MKKAYSVFALTFLFFCGFTIVTPEMIEAREKLCEKIREHYGEKKLTEFVRSTIKGHPEIDGVKLSLSEVHEEWITMDWNPFWLIISGDWAMKTSSLNPHEAGFDQFTLFWMCDEDSGIFVYGHRDETGELVMDSLKHEKTVELNWM